MSFAEEKHQGAGLADASADREWQLVVDDSLVIGEFQILEKVRHLELLAQGFGVYANAHGTEFMPALSDVVPHQNVAVQAVSVTMGLVAGVGDPVIVIGSAHLVRIAVFQGPADPDNEKRRILLQNYGLAALARQVRIHSQQLF